MRYLVEVRARHLGEVFVQWAKRNGMAIQYIQPGKPNQNA